MPEPLATLEEVAAYLNVPSRTLYAWRYRGEGPSGFRIGRHVRYRWADVEIWIENRLQTGPGRGLNASQRGGRTGRGDPGESPQARE